MFMELLAWISSRSHEPALNTALDSDYRLKVLEKREYVRWRDVGCSQYDATKGHPVPSYGLCDVYTLLAYIRQIKQYVKWAHGTGY